MSYCIIAKGVPDRLDLEQVVLHWFAAGHEILWIPIYEVPDTPTGVTEARAKEEQFGGPRLICNPGDLVDLPLGIKGWLLPAHLDDTDVICRRETANEVSFGPLIHPFTRQRLTYRYDTEAGIPGL